MRETYDLPNDERIARYARPQLRSYLLQRLLDIMDRKVYGVPLTETEQRALAFLESELLEDDRILAEAAYGEFQKWQNQECTYAPPAAPASVEEPVIMPEKVQSWCNHASTPPLRRSYSPPRCRVSTTSPPGVPIARARTSG